MRFLPLTLAAMLAAAPALAEDEAHPSLAEVMDGATAMASIADAFLFVAKPEGSWVCAINMSSNHFAALVRGDDVVAEQTVPNSVCVPATHFKNAME